MADNTRFSTRAGRHQHNGTTSVPASRPIVPTQQHPEQRTAHAPRTTGVAADDNGATAGKLTGELPVPPQQRTRVDLTEPSRTGGDTAPHDQPAETGNSPEEPAPGGLGVFDLGSVPASVTPPGTWRRAAWFAAASSGSVVGLLFAGAFMLGQQSDQQQDAGDWNYLTQNDDAALVEHGQQSATTEPSPTAQQRRDSDSSTGSATGPTRTTRGRDSHNGSVSQGPKHSNGRASSQKHSSGKHSDGSADDAESAGSSHDGHATAADRPADAAGEQGADGTQEPGGEQTSEQTTSGQTTQSPETTVVQQHQQLAPQRAGQEHDPDEMVDTSTDYLNAVANDPEKASQYTSGDLRDGGADELRNRYAQVTDLDVQRVSVDPDTGVTENTVDATYEDGHTERETVQLTFDDDGKISAAER